MSQPGVSYSLLLYIMCYNVQDCKKRGGTEIETASSTRQHVGTNKPLPSPIDSEDIEVEKFKCILEYYNLWGPLPGSNRLRCIRIEFLPKLQVRSLSIGT